MNTKTNSTARASAKASVAVAAITSAVWAFGTGDAAKEYKVDFATDLGLKDAATPAVAYLLTNGFRQSMADSIAGYAKELRRDGLFEKPADPQSDPIPNGARTYDDATVAKMVVEALDERFAAIIAGEVGFGNAGPRLRGVDKVMRDVAVERLRASYIANPDLTAPKGDDWAALVTRYTALNDADLRAEANKRLHTVAVKGDDLAALMAGVAADKAKAVAA